MSDYQCRSWLVVPKPIKGTTDETVKGRCWRLSFQDYEREKLKKYDNLKMTIRLIKKLRDALGMNCIASYYIKTLFLWKVERNNKEYWQTSLTVLYGAMVEDLYNAIKLKNIPYFWNKDNNLIESLKPGVQSVYAEKLKVIIDGIQANDLEKCILPLLTQDEMHRFKCSEFYLKRVPLANVACVEFRGDGPLNSQGDSRADGGSDHVSLLTSILAKLDVVSRKLEELDDRVFKLEETVKSLAKCKNNL